MIIYSLSVSSSFLNVPRKKISRAGKKWKGVQRGGKLFARERNQTEASPAACSFRAEPSKIPFSF
jgi:hypothetical protein